MVNDTAAEGAGQLATHLAAVTALRVLRLGSIGVGSAGAVSLAALARVLPVLGFLDLSENAFGDEGAAALAPALASCTSLEHVNVYNCGISAAQHGHMTATFAALPKLLLGMLNNCGVAPAIAADAPLPAAGY